MIYGYSSSNSFVDNWSKRRKNTHVSNITYACISNHLCLACMCKRNCYKPSSNWHCVLQTDGPECRQPGCNSWIQTVFGECRVSSQECFSGWMSWVCSNPVRVYVNSPQKWTKHITHCHLLSQKVGKCFQSSLRTNLALKRRSFVKLAKCKLSLFCQALFNFIYLF